MARTQYNLRHKTREEKREYRAGVRKDFDAFVAQDAEAFNTGGFLEAPYRPSASLPGIPEGDMKSLDDLLERHGFVILLKAMRELADGRAPTGDYGDSFEVEEDRDHWREKADALENLLRSFAK